MKFFGHLWIIFQNWELFIKQYIDWHGRWDPTHFDFTEESSIIICKIPRMGFGPFHWSFGSFHCWWSITKKIFNDSTVKVIVVFARVNVIALLFASCLFNRNKKRSVWDAPNLKKNQQNEKKVRNWSGIHDHQLLIIIIIIWGRKFFSDTMGVLKDTVLPRLNRPRTIKLNRLSLVVLVKGTHYKR